MHDVHKHALQSVFKIRLSVPISSTQTSKNAVGGENLQIQFSITEYQGKTCGHIYTVSCCADDKTKN